MKKYLLLAFFLMMFFCSPMFSQVTGVKYLMKYNCETEQYDVKLKIVSGAAGTIADRIQFNSQITIVTSTGAGKTLTITDKYMPLRDNQSYTGTIPMNWEKGDSLINSPYHLGLDFYPIFADLSSICLYNDIHLDDEILLFSFILGDNQEYDPSVRFFDNQNDVSIIASGWDYSNGFTMGGISQLYQGNIHENCITATEENPISEINIYPNPTTDKIIVDLPNAAKSIQVFDINGLIISKINSLSKGEISIDMAAYQSGLYFIVIDTDYGVVSRKVMKY